MLYNASHSARPELNIKKLEQLENMVTELKVLTHFIKEGLNVPDDPTQIRIDVQNEAE